LHLHATWTHCNFAPSAQWLEPILVMPRYHHWHHSSQKEAIEKNFAIHFPWIDKLFGTHYLPKEWSTQYGLADEQIGAEWETEDLRKHRESVVGDELENPARRIEHDDRAPDEIVCFHGESPVRPPSGKLDPLSN